MRYKKIEQMIKNRKLDQLLSFSEETFDEIDMIEQQMKNNITSIPEECVRALNEMTGHYMFLNEILELLKAQKLNVENRFYDKLRMEAEKEGEKFTNAVGERQSSLHVADYRRVRNLFQGYVNSAEQSINSLKAIYRKINKENNLKEV